jgi:proteasome accessory factor B
VAVSKVERLLTLMAVLLEASRPLTASEIRARVPGYPDVDSSFRRAFERDKDDLRDMGVPLRIEAVPQTDPPAEGYRIRKQDYYLRDPGLEPAELEALNLAASTVHLEGGPGIEALWKLGGAVGGAVTATHSEVGPGVGALPVDANLVAAFTGVMERRVLRFTYRDVEREVNPYRLDFVRGRWYLNGFDQVRGEERWYRLSRVDGSIVAGDKRNVFVRPEEAVAGLQLDPWLLGEGKPLRARVLFDAEQAPLVRHSIGPDRVDEERADGSIVVGFDITNRDGFRSFVLSYLDHAVILDPPELRDDIVSWLEALAGR